MYRKLLNFHSGITGKSFEPPSWITDDYIFIVQEIGLFKYEVIPNTNDMDIVGNIDFSKLKFNSFDEVRECVENLNINNK